MERLDAARDAARAALEPVRQAGDKAAAASTRPGTRRWLQGEHAVALHAAVEEAVEGVCQRMELRVVRRECEELVADHDEDLVRAALAHDSAVGGACAGVVGRACDVDAVAAAALAGRAGLRSEPPPRLGADRVGPRGLVRKLVAHTFDEA
eukprot:3791741-Prymnesium_polylepis.1